MVVTLTEAGLIRRTPGVARSIELLVDPEDLPALRRSPNQPIKTSVARSTAAARASAWHRLDAARSHIGIDHARGVRTRCTRRCGQGAGPLAAGSRVLGRDSCARCAGVLRPRAVPRGQTLSWSQPNGR